MLTHHSSKKWFYRTKLLWNLFPRIIVGLQPKPSRLPQTWQTPSSFGWKSKKWRFPKMVVPCGTPKSSILTRCSIINHPFLEGHLYAKPPNSQESIASKKHKILQENGCQKYKEPFWHPRLSIFDVSRPTASVTVYTLFSHHGRKWDRQNCQISWVRGFWGWEKWKKGRKEKKGFKVFSLPWPSQCICTILLIMRAKWHFKLCFHQKTTKNVLKQPKIAKNHAST